MGGRPQAVTLFPKRVTPREKCYLMEIARYLVQIPSRRRGPDQRVLNRILSNHAKSSAVGSGDP